MSSTALKKAKIESFKFGKPLDRNNNEISTIKFVGATKISKKKFWNS